MAVNARQYREHLYRLRSHPSTVYDFDFVDQRDSFIPLYLSLLPFLFLEYLAEASYDYLPSGLLFPMGFLLFWAFFYTYYKPGFLEDRLTLPQKWDLVGIPTVLLGVVIWFVKVTVIELAGFFLRNFLGIHPRPKDRTKSDRRKRPRKESTATPPPYEGTGAFHRRPQGRAARSTEGIRFNQAPRHQKPVLPQDVLMALRTLGLREGVDWTQIHRRYRELAKLYHPDLNKEITSAGRRFMIYDAAYRKLASVKVRYFPEKRAHG